MICSIFSQSGPVHENNQFYQTVNPGKVMNWAELMAQTSIMRKKKSVNWDRNQENGT